MLRLETIQLISRKYLIYLTKKQAEFFIHNNTGSIVQKLMQAHNDLYAVLRILALNVLTPVVQLMTSLIVMIYNQFLFVALLFVFYTLSFLIANFYYSRKLTEGRLSLMEAGRQTYSVMADSVSNIQLVRQFDGLDLVSQRYRSALSHDAGVQARYWKTALCFSGLNSFLFIVFFSTALCWAIVNVFSANITVGSFVMVASYVVLLSAPLESLGAAAAEVRQAVGTLARFLKEIESLESAENRRSTRETVDLSGGVAVDLRNVSFRYANRDICALSNVSLSIDRGSVVALTGPSGSGKTSFLRMLLGEYMPLEGAISLFGRPLTSLNSQELSKLIGVASQDALIFADTVRFNLLIADPSATDETLRDALGMAGLAEQLASWPAGLDTTLGDKGATLSGGQRQRLSLARLFLKKPEIILIDEGTAALDLLTEHAIMRNIVDAFRGNAIIMITHRTSVLRFASEVVVLDDGKIAARGALEEIIEQNAFLNTVFSISAREQCETL